jgi:hypothetical protein
MEFLEAASFCLVDPIVESERVSSIIVVVYVKTVEMKRLEGKMLRARGEHNIVNQSTESNPVL